MITQRTVTILGTLTLVAALGAGVAVVDRLSSIRTTVESERLYPDFDRQADAVNQIQVLRADGNADGSLSIAKSGDGWILEQRDGYPVRADTVRKLMFDIGQLELIERKTMDPGRFDRLNLRDVAQSASKSTRIVLTTAQGDTLVDLHVGKRRDSLSGGKPMVYVRRTDDDQTYLAEGDLEIKGKAPLWLFREVVNVAEADIRHATVVTADGERLELERIEADGKDFRIVALPDGRKIDSQYKVNNAATVLDKLLFDDVRSSDGLSFDPTLGHATYTTKDGVIYTVEFAEEDAGVDGGEKKTRWLRVAIAVPEAAPAEVVDLAAKHRHQTKGWAFRISDWEMERMTASMETLTKPAEAS